jgi:hypothetical protein
MNHFELHLHYSSKYIKKYFLAGHWWLTLVILATQQAEIRRIMVRSQPRQIIRETLSQKIPITKKGWWSGSRPSTTKKLYTYYFLKSMRQK